MADSKVMVLGNGRVGKTQFCRRLRGEDYDPAVPSTHGITVGSAPVPAPAPGGEAAEGRLHLWDFGGQDIYHGTHALFLRSRAIFAILWTPEMERNETHAHDGMTFRNYPLAYWLDYVERFGGRESPVLVVQAQCESARAEEDLSDDTRERLARFPLRKVLTHSARTGRGEAALWEAIAEFHGELDKPAIGRVRARVKARLEALRDADAAEPDPARRRHRTLPFADFEAMCAEEGGVADTRLFLDFLHNAGTVFHRPGLFGDRLILDQGWALEAIYAVFHRQACYRVLEQAGGRFTRSLLGLLLWDEGGYSVEEQELFISLMESCGVCFRLRPGDDARNIEAEYIAPDLLPETRPAQAAREWDEAEPTLGARMSYDLLPPSLMRGIIARIGRIAGLAADYWRTGVYLYERRHRSRGLVEVAMDPRTMDEGARDEGAWSGTITLRTQGGRHDKLADALYEIVTEESERLGLHDWSMRFINTERERDADGAEARRPRRARARPEGEATGPTLEVSRERSPAPQWFVSYAWADNTEETGRPVDRLCAEAERRGRTIRRDNRELGPGDSIEAFMQALGAGDRIFVFLSQAYLRSPACMFELHEIWRHAGEDGAAFLDRVRIHLGADAALGDRVGHANHWLDKKDELEALIRRNPAIATGAAGRDYEKIRRFADKTYDILALVAGHIQPRTLEELSEHGLDDA
ncbi:MAG: COR domain-containing protein [Azospirillaceae bacterium]